MTSKNSAKRTQLFDLHQELGAKMVDFGGWSMPVSFAGVLDEHHCVRNQCGLFDVSHMGEIFVRGKEAAHFLQTITINDIERLNIGEGQYTALCNHEGGMIDDLILYRVDHLDFLLCVNAANIEKDEQWIVEQSNEMVDVTIHNTSDQWSQLAIQGPKSIQLLKEAFPDLAPAVDGLAYMQIAQIHIAGQVSYLARTGYTGELGFEIYLPNGVVEDFARKFLAYARPKGAMPIGLGARDTLRLEACYLLYGNDMDENVSPLEAGIGWATKLDKGPFLGREALLRQKENGVPNLTYGFKMIDAGIPRHGMRVFLADKEIGIVTSGSVLPTVGGAGGLMRLHRGVVKVGDRVDVDIRGKRRIAEIVKKPLYSANTK